jgi:hypothetical protein
MEVPSSKNSAGTDSHGSPFWGHTRTFAGLGASFTGRAEDDATEKIAETNATHLKTKETMIAPFPRSNLLNRSYHSLQK